MKGRKEKEKKGREAKLDQIRPNLNCLKVKLSEECQTAEEIKRKSNLEFRTQI
jgi:hypothetical protein